MTKKRELGLKLSAIRVGALLQFNSIHGFHSVEILLLAFAALASVLLLWLNFLATLAVKYDNTLDKTQKIAQSFIIWLVPLIGAGFVLHLVFEHDPHAIPRGWIP